MRSRGIDIQVSSPPLSHVVCVPPLAARFEVFRVSDLSADATSTRDECWLTRLIPAVERESSALRSQAFSACLLDTHVPNNNIHTNDGLKCVRRVSLACS